MSLITLSNKGYIKRLDQDEFTAQNVVDVVFKELELRMMTLFVSWFQPAPTIICSSLPIKDVFIVLKGMKFLNTVVQPKGLPVVNL